MSHLQESRVSCLLLERDASHGDVPLMSLPDLLVKIAEWGNEFPIFLTLQVRTGALSTALREFGAMCRRAENYEMAVEVFLAAVSMKSDDCWLWHNLSTAYQGAAQEHRALQCVRRALDLDVSHAEIWTQYSVLLRSSGQAKQAENAFQRALALAPENAETHCAERTRQASS